MRSRLWRSPILPASWVSGSPGRSPARRPMLVVLLTATSVLLPGVARGLAVDFPPFLPDPGRFPAEIRSEIASIWSGYTFTRAVSGRPARAPVDLFRLFVDLPEVTAAASRQLGLARPRVRRIGPDLFEADDREGASGTYRVLVREPYRRVLLTQGSHTGAILGQIGGASLTVLTFALGTGADGAPQVAQRIETFVRIDNQVAAFFARMLLPLFSGYVDRKIAEAFNITARVSGWAHADPTTFCQWLANEPELAHHRAEFAPLLEPCGSASRASQATALRAWWSSDMMMSPRERSAR